MPELVRVVVVVSSWKVAPCVCPAYSAHAGWRLKRRKSNPELFLCLYGAWARPSYPGFVEIPRSLDER